MNQINKKHILEWIILILIWILFWIWIFQLFISSFFWNIKTIDYILINNDSNNNIDNIKIIEKPILIIKTENWIIINDWIQKLDIEKIKNETNNQTDINNYNKENVSDINKIYNLNFDILYKEDHYKWWVFINELDDLWVENMKIETLTFNNWKIVPVVQSIWKNTPLEEIWRTYFNTDVVYLNKEKNLRAFVLYAHSNYWKGWVEIWEDLLKLKENDKIILWNKKIEIKKIKTKYDTNLEFDKILVDYWNNKYDVIFYTCYKINWKIPWKKFYLWKMIK